MDGSRGESPSWFATRAFADAADLARALHHSGIEYLPLAAGPYRARLTIAAFGAITLQRVVDRAHVARGALDPGVVALLLPLAQAAAPCVQGLPIAESEGVMLGEGAEVHALCPGDLDWVALSLPAALVADCADQGGLGQLSAPPGTALRLPAACVAPVRAAVIAATRALEGLPPGGPVPQALGATIADGLREALVAGFAAGDSTPPRATREAIRLVDAAEAMLHATPDRPLHTDQLSAALGVSARRLHKAFVAAAGMSPQAYLRRRRLMIVHAALKQGGGQAGLVKSVALAHGFWHLGHFARAYREQFGEAPSATLARASAGAYRRAVWNRIAMPAAATG